MKKMRVLFLHMVICAILASCYIQPNGGQQKLPTEFNPSTGGTSNYYEGNIPATNFLPSIENRHIIGDYFPSDDHNGLYKGYVGGTTLSYYDFESCSNISLCPQQGCAHQDATCVAYQGEIIDFGVYDDNWYCLIAPDEHTIRLQKVEPATNNRVVIWEIEDRSYTFAANYLTFSYGTVWFDLSMTKVSQIAEESYWDSIFPSEYMLISVDLESYVANTYCDNEKRGQYCFWGGSETGYALTYSVLMEEPLTYEEYMQENPNVADIDYASYLISTRYSNTNHQLYYHDSTSGEKTLICENVRMGDLNNCYGDQLYYRTIDLTTGDSTIYQLDLTTGETSVFWEDSWILNYTVLDNKLICLLSKVSMDDGGLYYVSLETKEKGLIDNNGYTEGMYFSLYGETQDRFIGLTATGMRGWILKTDFWVGNYDAILNLP